MHSKIRYFKLYLTLQTTFLVNLLNFVPMNWFENIQVQVLVDTIIFFNFIDL